MLNILNKTVVLYLLMNIPFAHADMLEKEEVRIFMTEMVSKHGFAFEQLNSLFEQAEISSTVLEAISRPAEDMPWYKYRRIFIRGDRIRLGVEFLEEHREILMAVEKTYGVPVEIIVAIIGVETRFGRNAGNYKVINSLATLAFNYPKRSKYFRSELEQFLLLTREQKLEPLAAKGSYAGAMGIPQFMPSSYRAYAVDYDKDGFIDIWNNPADAIGSVANYLKVHGWQPDESITCQVTAKSEKYKEILTTGLKPDMKILELLDYGITAKFNLKFDNKAKLLNYELENGNELWLGFDNFYVITRYNHSALYAMAVYQLSQEILKNRKSKSNFKQLMPNHRECVK